MPKLQRLNIPRAVLAHLLDRVRLRCVSVADLKLLTDWMDGNPTIPEGDWYKRFHSFIACGEGALVKTFLTADQSPVGDEVP